MKHKVYFDSRLYRQRAAGDYFRLSGWYIDESSQPAEFSAAVDGTAVPVTVKRGHSLRPAGSNPGGHRAHGMRQLWQLVSGQL